MADAEGDDVVEDGNEDDAEDVACGAEDAEEDVEEAFRVADLDPKYTRSAKKIVGKGSIYTLWIK